MVKIDPDARIGIERSKVIFSNTTTDNEQLTVLFRKVILQNEKQEQIFPINPLFFKCDQLIREMQPIKSTHEVIAVPVHVPDGLGHWFLALIDIPTNHTIILDSFFNPKKPQYTEAFKQWLKVIQVFSRLTEQPVDVAKHRFQLVRNSPQQPSRSLDCGIFCVLYLMYKITRDSSIFQRSSNQMRNLMNEILDNQTDTTLNYPLDYDLNLELNFNLKNLSRKNKISYELIDFSEI